MGLDDELSKFEEITRDVELSPKARRNARKLASRNLNERQFPNRPRCPERAPGSRVSVFTRIVEWAEDRAYSQARPWAR